MAYNTAPIFTKAARTTWGNIATANTAKDGTGTVVPVFTGASGEGSYIEKVIVQSLGTNVATVVRLFLNNGSTNATAGNNSMIAQKTVAATTNSETAELPLVEIPLGIKIPAGYVINATIGTTVSAGLQLTGVGGDYTA